MLKNSYFLVQPPKLLTHSFNNHLLLLSAVGKEYKYESSDFKELTIRGGDTLRYMLEDQCWVFWHRGGMGEGMSQKTSYGWCGLEW